MNREVGQEREGVRHREDPVTESGRGHLDDVELGDGATLMIAQEGEGGAEAGAEGRRDLRRVGGDDRELAVVDGQLVLDLREVP